MAKTLVLMLDAFRKDYINRKNTPCLFGLVKKYGLGILQQPFGFKGTAGFYTGVHPKKLGLFVNYIYEKNSKKINPLLIFLLKLFPRKFSFYLINFLRHFNNKDSFFPAIDVNYLKHFILRQNKHFYQKNSFIKKTLFDVFRENKVRYVFYDFPLIIENGESRLHFTLKNNDDDRFNKFLRLLNEKKDYDFFYVHFVDLDPLGHYSGTDSEKLKNHLKKLDNMVKIILSKFSLEKDSIIVYSDHGMVDIKKIMDLKSKLPEFGKGYLYFLESTMARFWFFNENKKKEVLDILKKINNGRILSDNEKKSFGIDFNHNFYGDEIFLADSGALICPNFFQDNPCKGMHGYDVSDENEKTIFIINKKAKNKAKMHDLFPTLLDLMNLKKPENIDGKSLLV